MSQLLENLNPQQKEAVTHAEGPLLILAGAGSGKTRVLTYRMAYLLEKGVGAHSVLGVTFTNKAAGEMLERVQKLILHRRPFRFHGRERSIWVTTFHSACLRILRKESEAIGIKKTFTVYDEQDQLVLIKECFKDLEVNERQVHPKGVREAISRAKDYLKTPQDLERIARDVYEEAVVNTYELYEKKLRRLNGLDFGDLIMKTVELFEGKASVLADYQERFKYILVDEYQDTNHAQYRFLKLLAERYQNIAVVGDPDQAIYQWRGADLSNILNFERDYPQVRTIRLEQNYRSTDTILQAANHLIRSNTARKHKDLWGTQGQGEPISLYEASDEKDEAMTVVRKVLELKQEGVKLEDIVVFYRVHAQSRILEDCLRRFKVPYTIVGGIRFYDRKEIKDLLAYLRLVVSPHDDISAKRVLNVPARGIGKKAFEVLEAYQNEHKLPFFETLKRAGTIEGLTEKAQKAIGGFVRFIECLQKKKKTEVSELLEEILEETQYIQELESQRTIEAKSRIENIKEFFSVVYEFEENPTADEPSHALQTFLESMCLQTDLDHWENESDILTLMTLHSAKGLEFPYVFIVGLEEEVFPHASAIDEGEAEIEEERRLCYVGLTRAKRKLFLSFANTRRLYGYSTAYLPSRFLGEIPSELMETAPSEHSVEIEYVNEHE